MDNFKRRRLLRQQGKSVLTEYNPTNENIYDEVDETSYQLLQRKRMNDDFIVDDDGLGYVDYGEDIDEWGVMSGSESEGEVKKEKSKSKKEGKKKESKQQYTIEHAFQRAIQNKKTAKKKIDDLDLDDILNEIDEESMKLSHAAQGGQTRKKLKKGMPTHSTRPSDSNARLSSGMARASAVNPFESHDDMIVPYTSSAAVETAADELPNAEVKPDLAEEIAEQKPEEMAESPIKQNTTRVKQFNTSKPRPSASFKPVVAIASKPLTTDVTPSPQTQTVATAAQEIPRDTIAAAVPEASMPDSKYFYYLDITQVDNNVYIFGRILSNNSYESCTLRVQLDRKLYLMPATDDIDMRQLYTFIDQKLNVPEWKLDKVTASTPTGQQLYYTVEYAYKYPVVDLRCELVEDVLYEHQSALELFILSNELMGPSFIEFCGTPSSGTFSHTRHEYLVKELKVLSDTQVSDLQLQLPKLSVLSLSLDTVYENDINSITRVQGLFVYVDIESSQITSDEYSFSCELGKEVKTEKTLLNYLIAQVSKLDPDCLLSHNLLGFHLDLIQNRCKQLSVNNWSRLGRLKRDRMYQIYSGRMQLDSYFASKESVKMSNYSLESVCKELDITNTSSMHQQLQIILKLMYIPLTKQLTQLSGYIWNKCMRGLRNERNEYLLLHEFTRRGVIYPNPRDKDTAKEKEEDSHYEGGLVLEPKRGLYTKYVLVLDFNSLYPSIIQEYEYCFIKEGDKILPKVLSQLVEKRRIVKQLIKSSSDESETKVLNIRQLALKLLANSMYGCLGFQKSRFYNRDLAMQITSKGRDILMDTRVLSEEMNLNVIYGDTDSIMIYTATSILDEAMGIGKELKQRVNKKYKLLEIEIDAVYEKMLLLKKKKYAAITDSKMEIKGLDLVRRDWCQLTKQVSMDVLKMIFDCDLEVLMEKLVDYFQSFKNGLETFDVQKFAIVKSITKSLEEYQSDQQDHVQLAKRLMKERGLQFKRGDFVEYVVCKDGIKAIDEIKVDDVDLDYYIRVQIYPPVSRLLSVVEGVEVGMIGGLLGVAVSNQIKAVERQVNVRKYDECDKFIINCMDCHSVLTIGSLNDLECQECKTIQSDRYVAYKIQMVIRDYIRKYYSSMLVCDECHAQTRQVSVYGQCKCGGQLRREYGDGELQEQIEYYRQVFKESPVCRSVEKYYDRNGRRYIDMGMFWK